MHKSIIFTALIVSFLSVPVASSPFNQSLDKRSYTGTGTWFRDGLGACGYNNVDSDSIVALSKDLYGSGGYCNQWVTITNTANGQTAHDQVRDECMSCATDDLDMSIGLFQQLGDLTTGMLPISWDFMPAGWSPSVHNL